MLCFSITVTSFGLTTDKVLRETNFPCSKKHPYQWIKVARDAEVDAIIQGAQEIIQEVGIEAASDTTEMLLLTPSPLQRSKRKIAHPQSPKPL